MENLPLHTFCRAGNVPVRGFGCLQCSLSSLEQAAGETSGSQAQQHLSQSDGIWHLLPSWSTGSPWKEQRLYRLKSEMPQHYSCSRPACLWQLKDKLVGAELALILAKSSAGILPTALAVFCPGAGCIQSSFVRNIILKGALGSFKIKDVFSEYKTFIT